MNYTVGKMISLVQSKESAVQTYHLKVGCNGDYFSKNITPSSNMLQALKMMLLKPLNPRLTYQCNKENDQLCMNMVAINYASSATDVISDQITAVDTAEFIREWYSDCGFILDVQIFNQHQ